MPYLFENGFAGAWKTQQNMNLAQHITYITDMQTQRNFVI
jgi:hypothetical protein